MSFRSGSVSYASFHVVGGPTALDDRVLENLAAGTLEIPAVGKPPELQAGWVAGRHVYDTLFDEETVCFGDGLLFGMRIDTNRVPAEIRRAYVEMARNAQRAGGEQGGAAKRAARDDAEERCRQELTQGRHRKSKFIPVWWNVARRTLLAPAFSDAMVNALADLMHATFDARLEPRSAGALAREMLEAQGRTRDLEDIRPTPFTPPPPFTNADDDAPRPEGGTPAVPWSYGGPEPNDFLGNEFLLWLWSRVETETATFDLPTGTVGIAIDRILDMDCAWGATGKQTLRADGPTRLPEARAALALGKWPRKAGLIIAAPGGQWELVLQADRMSVTGAKLPKDEDAPTNEREIAEVRLASIESLHDTIEALYRRFVEERFADAWRGRRESMQSWARGVRRGEPVKVEV